MGVDYTAKAAFGIPVGDMPQDVAEDIDSELPSPIGMIEFGSASYGGNRTWILGVHLASCDFNRGGEPAILENVSESIRRKIAAAVKKHGLLGEGKIGYYIGGLVW